MAKKINLRNIYFNVYDIGGPVGSIVPKGYGKPNFNLTSKINPSKVGIPSGGSGAGSGFLSNLGSNITSFLGSGLGINMVSNAAFGLLNPNGNSTGIGNAMQTIGGLASNIPGVGGIAGAAVGAVGGLVNAAFGSKINEENVALFRALNLQQANYTSNASTNEELLADFGSMLHLGNVARKDIGSDGWFSNKAKKLTRKINAERQLANLAAITSLGNTALTVDTTNDLLKEYNYVAYGGPIDMKYTGTMSPFGNQFKDGGIFIKPSKRGTFTAAAKKHGKSVLAFASQVLANKDNYSPAMVKKANFARNAAKFKHKDGGPLDNLVADINIRSKADFVQRLLDPNRAFILDWATGGIATHKLGWATDDNGEAIVFPSVQRINGELYDFTDPKNGRGKWDAYDSAVERGDTLRMTPEQADLFTRTYKSYYPKGRTFEGELNAAKWKHDEGGPLNLWEQVLGRDLTELELLNVRLKRTPWGTPLELGLKEVHPELLVLPSGGASKAANLGISTGKKFITKSLRMLKTLEDASETVANKADEAVYRGIEKARDIAIEKFPLYGKLIWEAGKGLKHGHKVAKELSIYPAFLYNNTSDNINDNMETIEPLLKPLKEGLLEYAFGGELTHGGVFSNGTSIISNGGTHEENPYQGIQVGVDELGIPNLVELDELIWNDYVFSNRLKVPKAVKLKYKLRNTKDLKFAEAAKLLQKESEERPNDPISKNGLNAALSDLANEQEYIRMKKELRLNTFAKGGKLGNLYEGEGSKSNFLLFKKKSYPDLFTTPDFSLYAIKDPFKIPLPRYTTPDFSVSLLEPNASSLEGYISDMFEPINFTTNTNSSIVTRLDLNKKFKESPLRYAPIVGHAAGVISDIFSKPDYLAADEVRNIELNPSLVGFTPIGNKLKFTPYDINFQINKANANAGASRRNIMNTSGGNRAAAMAGLMGVDTNYYNALGDAYRLALLYNDAKREAVETFNRATDLYNSKMGLKASMANAESRNAMSRARYERDKVAALLGQLARDAYNTRRSNNLNILLEDIGNLGKERNSRNWADVLASRGVIKMNSKGEHLSKNGGKLNRKKKGGWEYA